MVHKIIIIAVILLILIVSAMTCHHRGKHCFRHASHNKKIGWFLKKLSKELNLSDSQKVEVKAIVDELAAKKDEFKGDRKVFEDAILAQMRSESVDQAQLNDLFEQKEAHFKEMRAYAIEKFAEFHQILTKEQRAKLAQKIEDHHRKMCH